MSYYIVKAKCGHVGLRKYIEIDFPVIADTSKQASDIVSKYPRVKKDHKDKILGVTKCTKEQYDAQIQKNNNDPYLQCVCIQEQNSIEGFDDRLVVDYERIRREEYKPTNKKESRHYRHQREQDIITLYDYEYEEYLDSGYEEEYLS